MAGFDLDRFVAAQAASTARRSPSCGRGRKTKPLDVVRLSPDRRPRPQPDRASSTRSRRAAEARAYLAHPLLGPRLAECTAAILAHRDRSAEAIFGPVDAMKLKSSMTLFEAVAGDPAPFASVLDAFFDAERDPATLDAAGWLTACGSTSSCGSRGS